MSKLYNTYVKLKKQDSQSIYLFKNGIFFIALDQDAYTLSNICHFKITHFTDTVVKCGFPCSNSEKYFNLFKLLNLNVQIIESNNLISCCPKEHNFSQSISELLEFITSVNVDNLSVSEAYKFIENLQNKVINIK